MNILTEFKLIGCSTVRCDIFVCLFYAYWCVCAFFYVYLAEKKGKMPEKEEKRKRGFGKETKKSKNAHNFHFRNN